MESILGRDRFTLRESSEKKDTFCYVCCELICGQAYFAEDSDDDEDNDGGIKGVHESCTKLPGNMEHPLHSQHPLTLDDGVLAVCNRCLYFSPITFGCQEGDHFNLCPNCAYFDHQASFEEVIDAVFLKDDSIHKHTLTQCKFRQPHNYIFRCHRCNNLMYGPSYICSPCKFFIHEVWTRLPNEIIHSRHPHPLILLPTYDEFVCNLCRDFSQGYRFSCKPCRFDVDIRCDSLMDDYSSKYDPHALEERERKANVDHFCHKHTLIQLNVNTQKAKFEYDANCCYCNQKVDDSSIYVCVHCGFYIHESCLDKLQYKTQHPYHPEHTLFALAMEKSEDKPCGACGKWIRGIDLTCEQCDFHLHHRCAEPKFIRPLKHQYHEHSLFYFRQDDSNISDYCCICEEDLNSVFYRCVVCNVNFHLECLPILQVEELKCHANHPLKLTDSAKGYDFEEYYCDICEEIGYTKDHLYYCEECIYLAHVDCVVTKLSEASQESVGITHFSHQHALQPCYLGVKMKYNCCYCNKRIFGIHHVCYDCKFFTHESCRNKVRVKEEVQHPYHPQHRLSAYIGYDLQNNNNHRRMCNACRGNIVNLGLWCEVCGFYLHYGCATNNPSPRPLKLKCHIHNLFSFRVNEVFGEIKKCVICNMKISGSSFYACVETECVLNINFHLECIPNVLPFIKLKCHDHKLIRWKPREAFFRLDVSRIEEYYCGICKGEGNTTKDDFYYCEIFKKCRYYVHIECVITEEIENECTPLPDECISLKDTNSDTEEKSDDAEQSSIDPLLETVSGSEDEQDTSFSDDQVEIHEKYGEGRSVEHIKQEETSQSKINAKIANICAEMEALISELDDVRATEMQSVISIYKEKIMNTPGESSS